MMNRISPKGVQFTRFFVSHDRSPIRITTDSILLGAWAPLRSTDRHILDIGTGCGIIAMMIAQRGDELQFSQSIDALDIDDRAYWQAKKNIFKSPFNNINTILQDFFTYANEEENKYDLVVSSPPYLNDIKTTKITQFSAPATSRQIAGYFGMNHIELLKAVKKILKPDGRFCLVLPHATALKFKKSALQSGWYCGEHIGVRYASDQSIHISLIEFSLIPIENKISIFSMRDKQNRYSAEYIELTRDFYPFI